MLTLSCLGYDVDVLWMLTFANNLANKGLGVRVSKQSLLKSLKMLHCVEICVSDEINRVKLDFCLKMRVNQM